MTKKLDRSYEIPKAPPGLAYIPLGRDKFVIIDAHQLPRVRKYCWGLSKRGYAFANMKGKSVFLHRFLLRDLLSEEYPEVDHKNGEKLDCRLENIRPCSHAQNLRNRPVHPGKKSCKTKGVYPTKYGTWMARIRHEKKLIYLGTFPTEAEAADAYKEAALKLQGEFARF